MEQGQSNLWAKSYVNDGYLMLPALITPEECNELESRDAEDFSRGLSV